jgi:hypothetical protein
MTMMFIAIGVASMLALGFRMVKNHQPVRHRIENHR